MKLNIRKLSNYAIIFLTYIFVLEPLWMLLPFAGFLYGSVLNLDFLYNSYYTIWLTYFILPPLQTSLPAAFPIALFLTFAGFGIFMTGAIQIYTAKLKKSGLVTSGLYKRFRHPQYTGLIIFGLGFILLWGRFITYILFTLMIFAYIQLARREEKKCLKAFGSVYEKYVSNSIFLFPGFGSFNRMINFSRRVILNHYLRATAWFFLIHGLVIILCLSILYLRATFIENIEVVKSSIKINDAIEKDFMFLVPNQHPMIQDLVLSIGNSNKVKMLIKQANADEIDGVIGFVIPRALKEKKEYYQRGRVDVYLLMVNSQLNLENTTLEEYVKQLKFPAAAQLNEVNLLKASGGSDIVKGSVELIVPENEDKHKFNRKMDAFFHAYVYAYGRSRENKWMKFIHDMENKIN